MCGCWEFFFVVFAANLLCLMRIWWEFTPLLNGTCKDYFWVLCLYVENLNFFVIYTTILFMTYAWLAIIFCIFLVTLVSLFCVRRGRWEFSVVCVVFTATIFVPNNCWWVFTFLYCNFNDTFCAVCVCNLMFLFFL
jgi:hypothetical protein